jgi:hypothetical protein
MARRSTESYLQTRICCVNDRPAGLLVRPHVSEWLDLDAFPVAAEPGLDGETIDASHLAFWVKFEFAGPLEFLALFGQLAQSLNQIGQSPEETAP